MILDAIRGDKSLFERNDGIERAWELVTPMIKDWESRDKPPLNIYQRGSWGPEEADDFIARDHRDWLICCQHAEWERWEMG